MKNQIMLLIIGGLLLLVSCNKKDDLTIEAPFPSPQNLDQAIANLFEPMVAGDTTVGVSVGIWNKGKVAHYFYGEKEKGTGEKPDANTLYEIGSITKTMTSILLADMVIDGTLSLEDPVEDYYPEMASFPNYQGQKILFKQLANHTSALPNIPDNFDQQGFREDNPFAHYSRAMLYDFLEKYQLLYQPGTKEEYSNLAYGLLGYSIAKIRNGNLEQQFGERIFEPLGMENTYDQITGDALNVAPAYNGRLRRVPMWDFTETTLGAGGIKSSLKDMLLYLEANLVPEPGSLGQAIQLSHQTTQELEYPLVTALGWKKFINEANQSELIWHNGGTAGTVSFLGFSKELGIGVVLLFNTEINERTGYPGLLELDKGVQVLNAMMRY